MQNLTKRYFWGLGATVVLACSMFAAKAAAHIAEAQYLGDPDHAPAITPIAPRVDTPVVAVRTKNGDQFASRNMFCSDCTPPVDNHTLDPSQIAVTTLPIALLATSIGPRPEESYATVVNSENQQQGAYAIGDQLPGANHSGKIKSIHFQYLDFENNGHTERLVLLGAPPPASPAAVIDAPPQPSGDDPDGMRHEIAVGIRPLGDSRWEIDKSLVEKVLLNPMAIAKGVRVVPSMKNGKPDGFKLYGIQPNSAFAKLGLVNGDTLQSINGFELTSIDKVLEVYTKLREATSLEVDLARRGQPTTLKYSIR